MTEDAVSRTAPTTSARADRARLLPHNRRLRHLHGITLRNLALSPATNRPRGRTFDDEALPQTFASPRKLRALGEEKELTHARSSGNLRERRPSHGALEEQPPQVGSSPKRPQTAKLRRRSTLDWTSGPSSERQHRYNSAIAQHTADVFFSLHVSGLDEPVYISETAQNVMNVDFRFFDLNVCHASITRNDTLTVKLWTKHSSDKHWQYLVDYTLNLRHLHYMGRSLEAFDEALAENTILLHLSDGLYMYLDGAPLPPLRPSAPLPASSSYPLPTEPTSSYDALMRLSTLDACIRDALHTRDTLIQDITTLVSSPSTADRFDTPIYLATAHDSNLATKRALESCRRSIRTSHASLDSQRISLAARRASMASMRSSQAHAETQITSAAISMTQCQARHAQTLADTTAQRRRIAADLQSIFPVEPMPFDPKGTQQSSNGLAFTIRGLALPSSSDYNTTPSSDINRISAALGHAAQVTRLLSFYLSVALPYPLITRSSASAVQDLISLMPPTSSSSATQRTFPLSLTSGTLGSSSFYRFEYAVFLLNKDIEALVLRADGRDADARRLVDIRQTLPNLGVLLFGLAGGERIELPARVRGGVVRGLSGHLAGLRGLDRSRDDSRESSMSRDEGLSHAREAALGWKGKGRMVGGLATDKWVQNNGHGGSLGLDMCRLLSSHRPNSNYKLCIPNLMNMRLKRMSPAATFHTGPHWWHYPHYTTQSTTATTPTCTSVYCTSHTKSTILPSESHAAVACHLRPSQCDGQPLPPGALGAGALLERAAIEQHLRAVNSHARLLLDLFAQQLALTLRAALLLLVFVIPVLAALVLVDVVPDVILRDAQDEEEPEEIDELQRGKQREGDPLREPALVLLRLPVELKGADGGEGVEAVAQPDQRNGDNVMADQLFEVFARRFLLQEQYNGLLAPVAGLQEIIGLEQGFVGAVREAQEHGVGVEIPHWATIHDVKTVRTQDAKVDCRVELLHEARLLCARLDAEVDGERLDETLHEELAREGEDDGDEDGGVEGILSSGVDVVRGKNNENNDERIKPGSKRGRTGVTPRVCTQVAGLPPSSRGIGISIGGAVGDGARVGRPRPIDRWEWLHSGRRLRHVAELCTCYLLGGCQAWLVRRATASSNLRGLALARPCRPKRA
ncbi:hypothetical protein FH972_024449 [Carpinus fangiana]|uniref:Uncharacterized protein n=1 Tax=Carpinus fangiana TaxID=176857 RepID=A0A5N6KYT1_9ROSI|nr:hypothetical protein FH972_024449 [Carpinus fangiana]